MPIVKDGRRQVTVVDMTPSPGAGSGPVERGTPRTPEAAASGEGFRPADSFRRPTLATREAKKKTDAEFMAASRRRGAEAMRARRAKAEPPKRPWAVGQKRSPEARANMAAAQRAIQERKRAAKAITESQGREVGGPATAVREHGPTGDATPAVQVATPLGSPDPTSSSPIGGGPDVVLPCEDCVHAAVCSIKPSLDGWVSRLGFGPPAPHSAISIGTIAISCTHHLAGAE